MSATYAIFEAEFRTAFRKNVQGLKKRIAGTFFIFFIGLIFSFLPGVSLLGHLSGFIAGCFLFLI